MRLSATDLRVSRDGRPVLHGVALDVPEGSWLAIIGPNGAGKSTLLQALAGLLPAGGEVRLGPDRLGDLGRRDRARRIAYSPQVPTLPAGMTVLDYTLLGRSPYISYLGRETPADRAAARDVLDRLDLTGLAARPLARLSGGERQRVVLARALTQQASILLLDEPTTALDLGHQQQVLDLVDELRGTEGLTVVSTLHDLSLAAQYADELTLLADGAVAACGTALEVLTEQRIAEHYGARVRVFDDGQGRPVIHLVR